MSGYVESRKALNARNVAVSIGLFISVEIVLIFIALLKCSTALLCRDADVSAFVCGISFVKMNVLTRTTTIRISSSSPRIKNIFFMLVEEYSKNEFM